MPEAQLPFTGFYNSWYDYEFEQQHDRDAEYIFENKQMLFPEGTTVDDIVKIISDHSNFNTYMVYVAKAYTDEYNNWLCEKLGFNVTLAYADLTSPKEYNFTTDRIFCKISRTDLHAIYAHVGRKRLREEAKKMFTSRDGFMSFYSTDIDNWGPSRTWDHNQIYCLLSCLEDEDFDMNMFDRLSEDIYRAFQASVDWPKVEQELEFFGLDEGKDMFFPHPGITDPEKYIKTYNELNHLKE
jgi:hypothetical protein